MVESPLETLFSALSAHGWRITVHDYHRAHLLLRTGGRWSVPRLRDSLIALLAKNQDEESRFVRIFQSVFDPHADEIDGQCVDLELTRKALQQLKPHADPREPQRKEEHGVADESQPPKVLHLTDTWVIPGQMQFHAATPDAVPQAPAEAGTINWDRGKPRVFRMGTVGGRPRPWRIYAHLRENGLHVAARKWLDWQEFSRRRGFARL